MPEIAFSKEPKTVIVHKEISQAYVKTGFSGFKRPDPRYYPLTVFNELLGGGGFDSKLVSRVRSDAGLTYSIYSMVGSSYMLEDAFSVTFPTKSESVNHALFLSYETIEEMVEQGVSKEQNAEKTAQFKETLPASFRTSKDISFTYLWSEFYNRDIEHFSNYLDKMDALKVEEVNSVSTAFFNDRNYTTVIVGDTTALFAAPDWNGKSIRDLKPVVITQDDLIK